jgi:predicted enzyme related to lactoylglutathione lyase
MGNQIVHWELLVKDLLTAKNFYSRVFDWKFDESTYPGNTFIDTGAQPGEGMMASVTGRCSPIQTASP